MYRNAKLIYRKSISGKECYLCHIKNSDLIVFDLKKDSAIYHICEKCVALVGVETLEESLMDAQMIVRYKQRECERKENTRKQDLLGLR